MTRRRYRADPRRSRNLGRGLRARPPVRAPMSRLRVNPAGARSQHRRGPRPLPLSHQHTQWRAMEPNSRLRSAEFAVHPPGRIHRRRGAGRAGSWLRRDVRPDRFGDRGLGRGRQVCGPKPRIARLGFRVLGGEQESRQPSPRRLVFVRCERLVEARADYCIRRRRSGRGSGRAQTAACAQEQL
jgi:hypothetical protein